MADITILTAGDRLFFELFVLICEIDYLKKGGHPISWYTVISEINKCYLIEKEIILKLKDFNDEIKFYYIQQYLEEFLKITDKILDKFYDNDEVMKSTFDFYKTIADESEGNFQNFEMH